MNYLKKTIILQTPCFTKQFCTATTNFIISTDILCVCNKNCRVKTVFLLLYLFRSSICQLSPTIFYPVYIDIALLWHNSESIYSNILAVGVAILICEVIRFIYDHDSSLLILRPSRFYRMS